MNTVTEMVNALKEKLDQVTVEAIKFEGEKAVNAAGTRARKLLQEIKKDIKQIRDTITEIKNKRKK
ncbi:MAG: hypothetical protein JW976_02570 [Syntrophaceae bacterium]|nr:hypothetical protein [Syntrophaceae bacterium]